MVINVGLLKSGDLVGLYNDISSVISAAAGIPVKVIVETSLLTKEQKISASVVAALAGAAYIKTSTGFNGGGATAEDVELMYQAVAFKKGTVKVKASGGVRSFEYAQLQFARSPWPHNSPGLPFPCCVLEPTGLGLRPAFQLSPEQVRQPVHTKVAHAPTLSYYTLMYRHWSQVCMHQTSQAKTAITNSRSPLPCPRSIGPRLCKVHEVILLLALHCCEHVNNVQNRERTFSPSLMPLRKCSCPNFVAPSLKAIIPASTQTAFSCAPLNSSVLLASSSKLTSLFTVIFRE